MIIAGGNPTLEWPNSRQTQEALKRLEFLMVIDVVRSPDSQYAHLILPACTFLERDEHRVNVYLNLPYVTLRRKVVEPVSGIPDQIIWVKLAESMGLGEYFPWKNCEAGIDHMLSEHGITFQDLVAQGGAYQYEHRKYKKYEQEGFRTPSGKVEIYPDRLRELGFDPSPFRRDALKQSEPSDEFPLFLSTGGNLLCFTHWQYRYIPKLRKMYPEPMFDIHPDTAHQHGLKEGNTAEVRTAWGKIQLKAHLTQNIRPDTVHIAQGWEEANANLLTGTEDADPLSGFPNLKSLRCNVRTV